MGRPRFVSTKSVRYEISDGDWIEVKQQLGYGDGLMLQTAGVTGVDADAFFGGEESLNPPEAKIDFQKWVVERMYLWLTDWSLRDDADKPVKLTREAIKNLDQDTAREISSVLDKHVKALEEEKKAKNGK